MSCASVVGFASFKDHDEMLRLVAEFAKEDDPGLVTTHGDRGTP